MFETRTGRTMIGESGGSTGTDDDFMAAGFEGIGATIMGRTMFGPVRGPWPDDEWRGWWGPTPPYHHDVFVLTHHARDPLAMDGGTTSTSPTHRSATSATVRSRRPAAPTCASAAAP